MKKYKRVTLKSMLPCHNCRHRINEETCKAFPKSIPEIFNLGGNIHTVKHPDQTGDFLLEPTEAYEEKMAERRAEADRKGQIRRAKEKGDVVECDGLKTLEEKVRQKLGIPITIFCYKTEEGSYLIGVERIKNLDLFAETLAEAIIKLEETIDKSEITYGYW